MGGQGPELPQRAALYMRLSRDDEGPGESASIASQRDILRAYAAAREIPVAGEYADDGFSGTHFERPDFQRLLRDIESGKIDCVITKDLSRLGRNSARTAELLEEYFPRHAVRFISVGDGFDSRELSGGMAVAAPFMLLMNELYARDISQKIRAALRSRMERGDFISAFAPYGYRKDPADRHRLLVDEEAAEVIRRIFRLAAAGRRTGDIAGELNAQRIPTPAAYRRRQRREGDGDPGRWSSSMLCKLLRNPVYLGQTAQGKSTKLSFKSRETRANPREEWIVAEGTHEPLVSAELFELARRRAAARRCVPNRGFRNLFAGLARCADCGRSMSTAPTRKAGSAAVLCCGSYKAHGAILLAFLLGLPANETVLPILLMIYSGGGTLREIGDAGAFHALLLAHGWTGMTVLCVLIFCVLHWPCSTTLLTIRKETGRRRWALLAALLPTALGLTLCALLAQLSRLV